MIRNLTRRASSLSPLIARDNISSNLVEAQQSLRPIVLGRCELGCRREHWTSRELWHSQEANLWSPCGTSSLSSEPRDRSFGSTSNFGKHHHERKLLGYTQEQLYAVVSDVKNYKEFVPWCQRSIVTEVRSPEYMEAELEVGFKMFVERYTSQVYMTEPSKVLSKVSDSTLFDHLDTTWEFKAGPTPSTTWLNFNLAFAFKSPLYGQIASVFFDEVVKRMMTAFENRCKQLYGESALHQKRRMQA